MNDDSLEPPTKESAYSAPAQGPNIIFRWSLFLLLASVAYYSVFSKVQEPRHLFLGLVILVLSLLPSLDWTLRRHTQIPVFAIFILTTLNTYALPLLNGHQELQRYNADTISRTAVAVIIFQATLILVHRTLRVSPGRGDFYEREILDEQASPWILGLLALVSGYTLLSSFSNIIPSEMASLLRTVFWGIGMICTFVCTRNWGRGALSPGVRLTVVMLILIQVLCFFSSLVMVSGISLVCLALIGYVSGSHRIPLLTIALLLPLIAILHNGKSSMRGRYWGSPSTPALESVEISTLPRFFANWVEAGLTVTGETDKRSPDELASRLLDRSSLFHMLCMVVHYTPDRRAYMEGDTYLDIPGQFVPRFLWPNKPLGHVSTTKLSVYYGLQREEDTEKTTIGFGLLPEAYANFGFSGACGLAIFFGALFKWVEMRTSESPQLSIAGIMLIIFTAWSFQTEFPLSMWLSSLFQACCAVVFLPLLYRKLFG